MNMYKSVVEVLDMYSQSVISDVALGGGDHLAALSLSEQLRAMPRADNATGFQSNWFSHRTAADAKRRLQQFRHKMFSLL